MSHKEIEIKFCIKGKKAKEITKQEFELIRNELASNSDIEDVVLEVVARNINEPRLTNSPPSERRNIFKEIGLECLWYRGKDGYPATFSFLQPRVVQENGGLPDCGN